MLTQNKLTKEQELELEQYKQAALKNAYNTERLNKAEAVRCVNELAAFTGISITNIVFLDSPKACQLARNEMQYGKGAKFQYNSEYYNFWGWTAYYTQYKFIRDVVTTSHRNEFPLLDQVLDWTKNLHYIERCGTTMFVSERPTEIHVDAEGRLHKNYDAALKYADGFGVYSLNGIRLNKEIVMSKPEDIDLEKYFLRERNAEVRREVFRKIGAEVAIAKLDGNKIDAYTMVIDSEEVLPIFGKLKNEYKYELYEVNLGNDNLHPFLKMWNPSIDAVHFEAVPKGTKTCEEALAFRNGLDKFVPPTILT